MYSYVINLQRKWHQSLAVYIAKKKKRADDDEMAEKSHFELLDLYSSAIVYLYAQNLLIGGCCCCCIYREKERVPSTGTHIDNELEQQYYTLKV